MAQLSSDLESLPFRGHFTAGTAGGRVAGAPAGPGGSVRHYYPRIRRGDIYPSLGVTRTSDFSDRCGDPERFFYRDPRAAARWTPDRWAGTRGGRAVHPAARVVRR